VRLNSSWAFSTAAIAYVAYFILNHNSYFYAHYRNTSFAGLESVSKPIDCNIIIHAPSRFIYFKLKKIKSN
jgi:hypothetical protein